MPNRDQTGPRGEGPKTGRQEGNCNEAKPLRKGLGRGYRRGFKNRQKDLE